jgi:hypothetical protein
MSITFRVGQNIDPSGFGLAVIDIPMIDPEKNISLVDKSNLWEENVSSPDVSYIRSYVGSDGRMPKTTMSSFFITNSTTVPSGDSRVAPLYYRHKCRFHHFTYGQSPKQQVYITDMNGNVIKNTNYKVVVARVMRDVYRIEIHTGFTNNDVTQYMVKYNRCLLDGTEIHPGWIETLNSSPIFHPGDPTAYNDEYSLSTPDTNGLYTITVPPVPDISSLINTMGISFENSPTIINQDVSNNVASYAEGVVVTYTLKATGTYTFTIKRDKTRDGVTSSTYLQSTTADTWSASPYNFTIGAEIHGILGVSILVSSDRYLVSGDEANFTASRSHYYMVPTSYSTIYLKKPEHVEVTEDWYVKVKNGSFRRRMDTSGNSVPSGYPGSFLFEYTIPEYEYQIWDTAWGEPYRLIVEERAEILDSSTIQLQRTPLFIDPDSVLYNPLNPGFPPSGIITIHVNSDQVNENEILDWDSNNSTVRIARVLNQRDGAIASYVYREDYRDYEGFSGSGGLLPINPTYDSPFQSLDLNPTPSHNYVMYASGVIAHVFLRPYSSIDDSNSGGGALTILNTETLYHNTTGTPDSVYDFELGTLALGPHCRSSDIQIIDVRNRGGGLSSLGRKNVKDVTVVQPETEFFWDVGYFDGQAVPSNCVLVISINKNILTSNGGKFTEDEIRKKVVKHMALGQYPIIEYVDAVGDWIVLEDGVNSLVDTIDGLRTEA